MFIEIWSYIRKEESEPDVPTVICMIRSNARFDINQTWTSWPCKTKGEQGQFQRVAVEKKEINYQ